MLQVLGVLVQLAGLTLLFLHWRAKRGLGGGVLVAAWTLMAIGAAPFFFHDSPEKALALGLLAPMAAGLFLLAPDALPRIGPSAAKRKDRTRDNTESEEAVFGAGRVSRNIARWFAALIAAPALTLAAGAAFQAFAPFNAIDRMVFSTLLLIAVGAIVFLWLLSTTRPWRSAFIACCIALALSAGVYAIVSNGAA